MAVYVTSILDINSHGMVHFSDRTSDLLGFISLHNKKIYFSYILLRQPFEIANNAFVHNVLPGNILLCFLLKYPGNSWNIYVRSFEMSQTRACALKS